MAWRLIEVSDVCHQENDLTDAELLGLSILVGHSMGQPDEDNVYYRAWRKLQDAAETVLSKE